LLIKKYKKNFYHFWFLFNWRINPKLLHIRRNF